MANHFAASIAKKGVALVVLKQQDNVRMPYRWSVVPRFAINASGALLTHDVVR